MLQRKSREKRLEARIAQLEANLREQRRNLQLHKLAIIGGVTLAWTKIEVALDRINELIFLNGGREIETQIPRALSRKVKFFRLGHNRLPWLVALAAEGETVCQRVVALGEQRHQIVHGAVEMLDADDVLKFVRHIHGDGPLGIDVREIALDQFADIAADMILLLRALERHHATMQQSLLTFRLVEIRL